MRAFIWNSELAGRGWVEVLPEAAAQIEAAAIAADMHIRIVRWDVPARFAYAVENGQWLEVWMAFPWRRVFATTLNAGAKKRVLAFAKQHSLSLVFGEL